MVVDARNRQDPRAARAAKVCAVARIRTQKALPDVKSFRPCCAAVREASARPTPRTPRRCVGARASHAAQAKVLLLSAFPSARRRTRRCACVSGAVRRGAAGCSTRRQARCIGRPPCENFSRGLLTVKKSVIRFRPADLACETSQPNRHPVAKHNQVIHRTSEDGGVGFASSGETQAHPTFDICLASTGRYPRIRHDAHDATAVPAGNNRGFALPGRFNSIDH